MADISPAQNDPGAPVIVARGVRKHYGPIHAVDGVDLEVRSGELFGLIGHDPWRSDDAIHLAIAHGFTTGDWLVPRVAGEPWLAGPPPDTTW